MILLKAVKIENIHDLRDAVQQAVELEHSTIPPYLTANFSLQDTGNVYISDLIGSVLGEEMLHLSIASNLLTAIGGHPELNKPPFIPIYPGPLPGGVETGLQVGIAAFSIELVQTTFMGIEEPEDPIKIESLDKGDGSLTIGEFYEKVKKHLTEQEIEAQAKGSTIFTGNPDHQMTFEKFFPKKLLFPITNLETACRGIDIIVDQGEGTTKDPFISPDNTTTPEAAHYYRFQEIVEGRKLVVDPTTKSGFSFTGDSIPFNDVIPNMTPNPKMDSYPVNSQAYVNSKLFNYSYTNLLNSLHRAFNGEPEQINNAMGLMFDVRLYALKLLSIPDPNNPGQVAGPSFEYVTSDDLTPAEKQVVSG